MENSLTTLSAEESAIEEQALAFARANKKAIARRLTDVSAYPPDADPSASTR